MYLRDQKRKTFTSLFSAKNVKNIEHNRNFENNRFRINMYFCLYLLILNRI